MLNQLNQGLVYQVGDEEFDELSRMIRHQRWDSLLKKLSIIVAKIGPGKPKAGWGLRLGLS